MKKQILLSFIFLLFVGQVLAQDKTIDSLKLALKIAKNDTMRCFILHTMIQVESNEVVWLKYNGELKKLVEAKLKTTNPSSSEYNIYRKYYASSIGNIGIIYENQGDVAKALECYQKALGIEKEVGNMQGMANGIHHIGTIYKTQGDVAKALECYHKSLRIREEIGDKKGIAVSQHDIGIIYKGQGDATKALEYLQKCLKTMEEAGNKASIASSLNNIGLIYDDLGDANKSLEYFQKSLKINQEIGSKMGIAYSYNYIGHIYYNQDDISQALSYHEKSLRIREELDHKEGIITSLLNIGVISEYLGDNIKALECYKRSLKLAQELGSPESIRDASKCLYSSYKDIGIYAKALDCYEIYITMHDSINNTETKKASIKSQFKYEYEKKATADSVKVAEEKKVVAVQLKQEKTQRFALYGGLVLVVLFAGFMFNRFRVTQKQKNIIELKEKETQQQNEIITIQKHLVEEKHKEITDSINYAERIQRSFLATEKQLNENLNNYFVLFKPKDVVSGDFYWSAKLTNSNFALATADSTGHGVPGAIMSLLNVTSLEKAIEHYNNPADILNHTRQTIIERLKKDGSEEGGKDGMDCSLLVFDFENKQLHIAAANNPVWIIRPNPSNEGARQMAGGDVELIEIKPDKMPVGKSDKQHQPFTLHTIELQKGDTIYTLTDGFPDQFGGPNGKKFMSKKLKELLLENVHLPIPQQKELLETTFKNWIGELEQVDDVCVVGIKI